MKMNSQIKAAIFDLDGLLIDSEPIWAKAFPVMMKRYGFKDDLKVHKAAIGMGLRQVIEFWKKKLGLKGDTDKLLAEYRDIFYNLFFKSSNLRLLDGAEEIVENLHKKYKLALATGGHTKEKCSQILKKVEIFDYFEVIVSSDDVKKGKPAPDVYLETAKQLGIKVQNCLVFEDAVNGIISAKAAGMLVFGVNADGKMRAELKVAGADEVYSSLSEVKIP